MTILPAIKDRIMLIKEMTLAKATAPCIPPVIAPLKRKVFAVVSNMNIKNTNTTNQNFNFGDLITAGLTKLLDIFPALIEEN